MVWTIDSTYAKLPTGAVDVLCAAGVLTVSGGTTATSSSSGARKRKKSPLPTTVQVHLDLPKALSQCANADDTPPPRRRVARALHALLCGLFGARGAGQVELDADEVYSRLRTYVDARAARPSAPLPELPALRPTLRGYQRDAVGWMLAREGLAAAAVPPGSELLWRCVHGSGEGDGTPLHWNTANGAMSLAPPPAPVAPVPLRGGILADEMGLGKSVEVISLLLAHPFRPEAADAAAGDAGAEPMEVEEPPSGAGDELPCVCQGLPSDFDGSWVGCDSCGRWVHACCAGFSNAAEAEAASGYRCLVCACREGERRPRACGATLLVCPAAILGQWHDEVAKHVYGGALRVTKYTGLREALHDGWKQPGRLASLQPAHLGACDLVLTSFETLRAELDHAPPEDSDVHAPGGRQMRPRAAGGGSDGSSGRGGGAAEGGDVPQPHGRGRGGAGAALEVRRTVSPLLGLTWWRLVLDEAQMVESGTAKAAAMARRLRATHRWAVSGTPMGRGRLADLQGLMAFLRLPPWNERAWWSHAIELPLSAAAADGADGAGAGVGVAAAGLEGRLPLGTSAEEAASRLLALLHSVMWRNSKASVEAQLALPPLREELHTLTLSSIERHFYARQHRECLASAQKALALRDTQMKLTHGTAKAGHAAAAADRALTALSTQGVLRLRQACCHPQLGAFGIKGRRGGGQHAALANPLSMRAILAKLLEDERSRCEEEQRKVRSAGPLAPRISPPHIHRQLEPRSSAPTPPQPRNALHIHPRVPGALQPVGTRLDACHEGPACAGGDCVCGGARARARAPHAHAPRAHGRGAPRRTGRAPLFVGSRVLDGGGDGGGAGCSGAGRNGGYGRHEGGGRGRRRGGGAPAAGARRDGGGG